MHNFIFLNDTFVESSAGCLSALDRGFLYGDGIFETLRTYSKQPFRIEDHINRLSSSAHYFEIPFPYSVSQIRHIIDQLLIRNSITDAYIRMTLSRGQGTNEFIPVGIHNPTFIIQAKSLLPYPKELYKTGSLLMTTSIQRSTTCPLSRHKTINYLTNYLIRKEAIRHGVHDALILNTDNYITECSVSNIFHVEKNTVVTPSLDANILPGITRKVILELCKEHNISVIETLFKRERILGADEVFLANSLMEIMPVAKIDGNTIGKSIPGTLTGFLHEKYSKKTIW
ncbi:MAG: aminotransferase class IV [Candidatus Brocadiaceae bacterium]|nr:aminotransferase class IV [Candidatus Brocadiaceae bacterium]